MFKSQFQRKILAHVHCQLWDKNLKKKPGDNNKNKYWPKIQVINPSQKKIHKMTFVENPGYKGNNRFSGPVNINVYYLTVTDIRLSCYVGLLFTEGNVTSFYWFLH
jgi:hypothetical protein